MNKFSKIAGGLLFFVPWTCFSGALTFFFAKQIHNEVSSGKSAWMYLIVLFPLCFVLFGIWGLITSFASSGKKKSDGTIQTKPKTEYAKSGTIGAAIFGSIFFLPGVAIIIFLSIVPLTKTMLAKGWDRVPAKVLVSEVKTNYDSDGDTHKAHVVFSYSYDGYGYESDTYDFQFFSTSGYKSVKKKIDSAPVGSRQSAYVNPKKPEEAVLSTKLSWLYLFTFLFGSVFAAVGGAIMFGSLFGSDKKGTRKQKAIVQSYAQSGPVVLKSRFGGPVAKFIGIVIFTTLWNGVVYFLFKQNAPMMFKIIFSAFGILMIFAVIHALLALFNPRPTITVNSKQVHLGDTLHLNWKMSGQTEKIKNFTVALVGQEEATYRRGTSTYTDRKPFCQKKFVELTQGIGLKQGSVAIDLPKHSMYTWKASNNKILWFIKVSGVIEKWPDMNYEYEITVLPLRV